MFFDFQIRYKLFVFGFLAFIDSFPNCWLCSLVQEKVLKVAHAQIVLFCGLLYITFFLRAIQINLRYESQNTLYNNKRSSGAEVKK